jgi:hypothetical protein
LRRFARPPTRARGISAAGNDDRAVAPVPAAVSAVLASSPGRPLDPGTRVTAEAEFGHDFGHVRLHTDPGAAESARAVGSLAYTVGHDIVFAPQQFAPRTAAGMHLLAHELTHVVQQRGAPAAPGAPGAVLQRYEAGEHAQLGARAGEAETKFTINKVEMTYGEMIAMGDLFADPEAVRKASESELRTLLNLIRRERDKGIGSVREAEWITATGGRYTELAAKNAPHFAGSRTGGGYEEGGEGNRRQWWTYHTKALRLAQSKKLDEALKTNAFADHFLTDAFSAGHFINKANVMERAERALANAATLRTFEVQVARGILASPQGASLRDFEAKPGALKKWTAVTEASLADVIDRIAYWKDDYFYSTFVKAVHDALNRDIVRGQGFGIEVENDKGVTWRLAGDKTLSFSEKTREMAREAVAQSRQNVREAEGEDALNYRGLADKVWAWVPRPTKEGQRQIDEATRALTDPADVAAVDAWVRIVVDNFDAVLQLLVDNGLLRRRAGAGPPDAGTAPSPADAGTSQAPPAPAASSPPGPTPAETTPTRITVRAGDSLSRIAAGHLGPKVSSTQIDRYWRRIHETNRDTVGPDPDLIRPGQILTLPPP